MNRTMITVPGALDEEVGPIVAMLLDGTEYRRVLLNPTEGETHVTPDGRTWIAVHEMVVDGEVFPSPFTMNWRGQARQIQVVGDAADLRNLAISTGPFRTSVAGEVRRVLAGHHGNQLEATIAGLDRLRADNLITDDDHSKLSQICTALFNAVRGRVDPNTAFSQVIALYEEMIANANASSVSLAVASAARSSFVEEVSAQAGAASIVPAAANVVITPGSTAAGAAIGAVIGAGIGGAVGGAGGAIVGGIIGGILGGAIGFCNENDV